MQTEIETGSFHKLRHNMIHLNNCNKEPLTAGDLCNCTGISACSCFFPKRAYVQGASLSCSCGQQLTLELLYCGGIHNGNGALIMGDGNHLAIQLLQIRQDVHFHPPAL